MYKMHPIAGEGYTNTGFQFLKVRETGQIWSSRKGVGNGIGVKNISDLVLKEIYGISETKNPTKQQINKYKMTEK